MSWWRKHLLLLLITALAAVFRLARLGHESFWFDELLTMKSATVPIGQVVNVVRKTENAPPLYFVLLNRWSAVFGTSEMALRMPSALAGVAAVGVVAQLGRRLFHIDNTNLGEIAGLSAAAILAVQAYHIAYSMEARPYALMFLLALWSCDAAAAMFGTSPRRWTQPGYVVAAGAMLWTHTVGGFLLIAINLIVLLLLMRRDRPRDWFAPTGSDGINLRRWLVLQAAVLCLMIPWLGQTLEVWAIGATWIGPTTVRDVIQTHACSAIVAGLWLACAILAMALAIRRDLVAASFCLSVWLVPILLPQAISALRQPMLIPRYALPSLAGITLLCGYVIARAARRGKALGVCAVAVVIGSALWISGPLLALGQTVQHRADLRSAGAVVRSNAQPGDGVHAPLLFQAPFEHYCGRSDLAIVKELATSLQLEPPPGRLWTVSPSHEAAPLLEGFGQTDTWTFEGVVVRLFRKLPEHKV
jgi:uncharacterized membrane protein